MKSFIRIVLFLSLPLNLYSQEIMQTSDVFDIFSDKIINTEYEPITLLFDFSKKQVLSYDYSSFSESFYESSLLSDTTNQKNTTTSTLVLNMLGNGYAEIIHRDVISDSQISFGISKDTEPINTKLGPTTIAYQYLSEDGKFMNNQDMEFKIKQIMPSSGLIIEKDKTIEEDITMPLNFFGSFLQIKGKFYIKGHGIYSIEDKQYLKLESRLELNSDNIPVDLQDQLELLIVSEGIYYYDINEKSYYAGDITTTMSISTKTNGFLLNSEISQKIGGTEHIQYKKN